MGRRQRGAREARARRAPAAAAPAPRARWEGLWVALGLAALVAGVYGQVVRHDFVSVDDPSYYLLNPHLDGRLGVDDLAAAFRPYFANWIPLTSMSIAVDNALYGVDPTGVLVTNACLHAIASILLFLALRRATGLLGAPAFVAAVFAVHPLHVESVAWAAQRKDVLMAVGFMAALFAYARYRERPDARRYAALVACAGLAMLAKPVAVTLPFALLLLDFWPFRRFGSRPAELPSRLPELRAALVEKLPLFALAAAASAAAAVAQRSAGATQNVEASVVVRLLNAGGAYGAYLVDAFWPSGLAVHYPYETAPLGGPAAASWVAILVLTALATRLAGARPHLLVGWLWFLGTLVPMIGLVQVGTQARADRYMYVPLVGITLALAWEAHAWVRGRPPRRRGLAGVATAVVVALSIAAHRQVRHWSDTESLLQHALAVTEDNAFAHLALAAHYRGRGSPERAEPHLDETLRIQPGSADARAERGLLRIEQGRLADARAELERALADGGDPAKIHAALGLIAERSGDLSAAVEQYRRALRADPQRREPANNLAWILATAADPALRDPAEAVRLAEGVAAWNAHEAAVLDTLAAAYAAAGRRDDALAAQRRALAAIGKDDEKLRAELEEHLRRYESGGGP